MILTDREIRIAIQRQLIAIDPAPDESEEASVYGVVCAERFSLRVGGSRLRGRSRFRLRPSGFDGHVGAAVARIRADARSGMTNVLVCTERRPGEGACCYGQS
jgi:hypothetical protein